MYRLYYMIIYYVPYSHVFPLFKKGYKRGIQKSDLFEPLTEHKSQNVGDALENIWNKHRHKRFGLHLSLLKLFGLKIFLMGLIIAYCDLIGMLIIPFITNKIVSYFELNQTEISQNEVYLYASIYSGCRLIDCLLYNFSMIALSHIAMKMRVSCGSLIYKKVLRMNKSAFSAKVSVGHVVNLLSNDLSKFDHALLWLSFVYIAPIEIVLGIYLLYNEIGYAALFGSALLISFIPFQTWLGNKCSTFRNEIATNTDKRIHLMNEIISGIQVIKMYCWEKPFQKLVAKVRKKEMKALKSRGFIYGLMYSFEMFFTRLAIFISIIGYKLMDHNLVAKHIFGMIAIYSLLRPTITTIFTVSIQSAAETYVTINRVQNFLNHEDQTEQQEEVKVGKPRVFLKNINANWTEPTTLKNVNLDLDSNELIAIIGAVGSGKSSLFNVILKELPTTNGFLNISGTLSYASQEPWLFNDTVRENILFGNNYDSNRYQKVVETCALESDFQLLPKGDKTVVGERGKALSGGQKARVNLARAIYKKADIYLLDDPLSAVDANVGKHLFNNIKDFLKTKICLLATHQLQFLNAVDTIIMLEKGEIAFKGTFEEFKERELDFTKIVCHNFDKAVETTEKEQDSNIENEFSEQDPLLEKEEALEGNIKLSVYFSYLKAGGGVCNAIFTLLLFICAQTAASSSDYFVAYWVNAEERNETSENLLYAYSGIMTTVIIFGVFHAVYFMYFFALASNTLHQFIMTKVISGTMKFFNNNTSGSILNKFSRELGNIDEVIPAVMYDVIVVCFEIISTLILIITVDIWIFIPSVILLLIFYFIRKVYIQTSRSLRRIEAIERNPIYSHVNASIHGLSTIKAFSAQNQLLRKFDQLQDNHSSVFYIYILSGSWLALWIYFVTIIFTSTIIFGLISFREDLHGGYVGLVLTLTITMAVYAQYGLRQWSELENQMVSVESLMKYKKMETEPLRSAIVSKNWPTIGQIKFENVSLTYTIDELPVLKNINVTIEANEKIGIVGRTGAGKTSIITALFQLYPIEGSIFIDHVDITKIPLHELRSKLAVIPQEPVLFSETLRKNLDPFDEYSDDIIWEALEQVEMKRIIAEMANGLQACLAEGGSNFSVGQRQLLCLARALIRKNKILVMDEATANVDAYTDALIQETIRKRFGDCTVLTIAHRLHTVLDSDKILVMSEGSVIEFDSPKNLLKDHTGIFYKLVQDMGGLSHNSMNE